MAKDLPTRAQAVIIGGGIVGCSVAYHLTKLGWSDVLLLERAQLTAGTTWHAAGLIGQLRATENLTRLAKYSAELYARLEAETGQATGFRQHGSLGLARTARALGRAEARGLDGPHLRPRGRGAEPGRGQSPPPAARGRGPGRRDLHPERRPGQPDRPHPGARQGRARRRGADRRALRGHRHHPGRRPGHRRADRARAGRSRGGGQLRRHVGPRGRPAGGRQRAAAGVRAFLRADRADRGPAERPAGAARPRRLPLRQGGRRQAAGRGVRAGRQALGHGRHPGRLRVRRAARGLGPLHAVPRGRDAPHPGARRGRHPEVLLRARELHPGRPLSPRRGARSSRASTSPRASTRSASSRPAAPARRSPNGSSSGHPPMDLWDVDIRRMQPFQGTGALSARPRGRGPGPALRDALAGAPVRDRAAGAALAAARAPRRARRLLRRARRLGAAGLVRRAGHAARV